jgi:beta-glucanase (GH16 family)
MSQTETPGIQLRGARVFTISAPVAGNYPEGLFKYPYKVGTQERELFTQTLEWSPEVNKTFDTNTQYTAVLTLDPVNEQHTLASAVLQNITGLSTDGVQDVSLSANGRSLVIRILFEATAGEKAGAQIIFSDEFDGTSLDRTRWDLCPEWDRHGRSTWKGDMVSVSGGLLRLKFIRDPALGATKTRDSSLAETWIRAGAVRTQTRNWNILFSNTFGYYESRIKFPVVSGTWGAFWLMSPTQGFTANEGKDGTEIDIVETIGNHEGRYNAALHWNGYEDQHKSAGSGEGRGPVNIYDGEFHVFALDWSPEEYIFYVDGKEFWRVDGGPRFNNSGINQNPNYIKLTVESAPGWAGDIPKDFTEAEMQVDYVRVYNQPRIN